MATKAGAARGAETADKALDLWIRELCARKMAFRRSAVVETGSEDANSPPSGVSEEHRGPTGVWLHDAFKESENFCKQLAHEAEAEIELSKSRLASLATRLKRPATADTSNGPLAKNVVSGSTEWNAIEIWFLSDERVRIRRDAKMENRNYNEFGFEDRRTGKPNQAWQMLIELAQAGGEIRLAKGAQHWRNVEKRMQGIRKLLREHFSIAADPLPFITDIGYKARFKIGCSPSSET